MIITIARLATVLGAFIVLAACSGEPPEGKERRAPTSSAESIEEAALGTVREALPLAVGAVHGGGLMAEAGWQDCLVPGSWSYEGAAVFRAPQGEPEPQLDSIRTVLEDADFTDVTRVEGQVAVVRDGLTLVFSPHRATDDPEAWQISFHSDCHTLSADGGAWVEDTTRVPITGW